MGDIKHPARILVVGRSRSGKTTMGVKLIEYLLPQVDELLIVSPTFKLQPTWDPIRESVYLAHDHVETMIDILDSVLIADTEGGHKEGTQIETKRLLVLDDVSYDRVLNEGNKGILNKLAYATHHLNLSILIIVHKSSNIGAGMKENADWLLLFKTVNNNELDNLYDCFGVTRTKKEFHTLFKKEIWDKIQSGEEAHPFIAVDFTKGGLAYYMLRERLQLVDEAGAEQVKGKRKRGIEKEEGRVRKKLKSA